MCTPNTAQNLLKSRLDPDESFYEGSANGSDYLKILNNLGYSVISDLDILFDDAKQSYSIYSYDTLMNSKFLAYDAIIKSGVCVQIKLTVSNTQQKDIPYIGKYKCYCIFKNIRPDGFITSYIRVQYNDVPCLQSGLNKSIYDKMMTPPTDNFFENIGYVQEIVKIASNTQGSIYRWDPIICGVRGLIWNYEIVNLNKGGGSTNVNCSNAFYYMSGNSAYLEDSGNGRSISTQISQSDKVGIAHVTGTIYNINIPINTDPTQPIDPPPVIDDPDNNPNDDPETSPQQNNGTYMTGTVDDDIPTGTENSDVITQITDETSPSDDISNNINYLLEIYKNLKNNKGGNPSPIAGPTPKKINNSCCDSCAKDTICDSNKMIDNSGKIIIGIIAIGAALVLLNKS